MEEQVEQWEGLHWDISCSQRVGNVLGRSGVGERLVSRSHYTEISASDEQNTIQKRRHWEVFVCVCVYQYKRPGTAKKRMRLVTLPYSLLLVLVFATRLLQNCLKEPPEYGYSPTFYARKYFPILFLILETYCIFNCFIGYMW